LEDLSIKDYEEARENIIKAEEEEGKSEIVRKLIDEVGKKLDAFHKCWLKYEKDKNDQDSLEESATIAREARLLSIDALEKAKTVDLKEGLKVVKILSVLVLILFIFYFGSHCYWHIHWFEGNLWQEVVFFSLFGVLTNLTYSAAKHVLQKDFDHWHLGWYISKIPQAPFITLAIILILKNISVEALGVPVDLGKAPNEVIIAVSYILGLFSRRAWELIERIKDWLLPVSRSGK